MPTLKESNINPQQEGLKTGLSSALSLSSEGFQLGGPVGAIAGAGLGGIMGLIKMLSAVKKKNEEDTKYAKDFNNAITGYREGNNQKILRQTAADNPEYFHNFYAKKGGKFPENNQLFIDVFMEHLKEEKERKNEDVKKFRDGGALNVIPKGVKHEEYNKLGDKGIPVILKDKNGKLKKVAEIEVNEIIFNKDISKELERRTKIYQENPKDKKNLCELGKLIQSEILNNTIDYQGELLNDNN